MRYCTFVFFIIIFFEIAARRASAGWAAVHSDVLYSHGADLEN